MLALACVAIALLAAVASTAGIFLRGDGATREFVSERGEHVSVTTGGVYAHNPERVVAEGVGWDWVTLVVAVPALLALSAGIAKGSLRARLLAVGVLAYLLYQYLMYAVFWALGPLFPLFIVIYPLAAAAIVGIVSTVDVPRLPESVTERFPRRGMAVFSVLVAVLLLGMWTKRIVVGLSGDLAGAGLLGMPTLTVQAMDLGMLVPLALATAALLWRSRPWGYLMGSVFAVKGVTMAGAICAMLLSAWAVEGRLEVAPFAVFAAFALASGALAARMMRSVREPATAEKPSAQVATARS